MTPLHETSRNIIFRKSKKNSQKFLGLQKFLKKIHNFEKKIEKKIKLSPINVTKLNFHTNSVPQYVTVSEILIKSKSFVVLAKQVLEFS